MWTLILFTRWPETGRTKTRLIPTYGAEGAAHIHRQMIEHTTRAARELPDDVHIVVALADAPRRATTQALFDSEWHVLTQNGIDLGERMANAIDTTFKQSPGCDRVVLV
ncbi:MAG: DUF2064 domain-containing protein, partial [Casimicrobium sp.]